MFMQDTFINDWKSKLNLSREQISHVQTTTVSGRVTRVTGLVMEAVGLRLPVGSACSIHLQSGAKIDAEVVGFDGDRLFDNTNYDRSPI
ncbi:MAG: hypothetical protein V4495_07045, partial [Pseudomonadota bacterium]